MIAQLALSQNGLSVVYSDMVGFDGNEEMIAFAMQLRDAQGNRGTRSLEGQPEIPTIPKLPEPEEPIRAPIGNGSLRNLN